jgi:hypothetical protein
MHVWSGWFFAVDSAIAASVTAPFGSRDIRTAIRPRASPVLWAASDARLNLGGVRAHHRVDRFPVD